MCSSCDGHIITINLPPPPPPEHSRMPPQNCPQEQCVHLNCTACGHNKDPVIVRYYNIMGRRDLCYLRSVSRMGKYCCQIERNGSETQTVPRRCQLVDSNMPHKEQSTKNKERDMAGGDDDQNHGIVIAFSTVGSLIVLLVLAIFLVLLIRTVQKKRRGHNLSGTVCTAALSCHLSKMKVFLTTH